MHGVAPEQLALFVVTALTLQSVPVEPIATPIVPLSAVLAVITHDHFTSQT
jgi:hypothetical protein